MRKAVATLGFQETASTSASPASGSAGRVERPIVEVTPQELLTPAELATRLKIAPVSVKRMLRRNELPFVLVGKRPRFDFSEVLRALRDARAKR